MFPRSLAISYERLGETHSSLGNLDKALIFFENEIELFQEVYHSFPQNVSFKNGLAISYTKLGLFYEEKGDQKKAQDWFNKAKSIWADMVKHFPQYAEFKNNLDWVNDKLK